MITYKLHKSTLRVHIALTILEASFIYGVAIYSWTTNDPDIILGFVLLSLLFVGGIYPWIRLVSHYQASKRVIITYNNETGHVNYKDSHSSYDFFIEDVIELESVSPNGVMSGWWTTLDYYNIWVKGIHSNIKISSMLRAKELIHDIAKSPNCKCTKETTFWSDME